jgi:hypothetical protein
MDEHGCDAYRFNKSTRALYSGVSMIQCPGSIWVDGGEPVEADAAVVMATRESLSLLFDMIGSMMMMTR